MVSCASLELPRASPADAIARVNCDAELRWIDRKKRYRGSRGLVHLPNPAVARINIRAERSHINLRQLAQTPQAFG